MELLQHQHKEKQLRENVGRGACTVSLPMPYDYVDHMMISTT